MQVATPQAAWIICWWYLVVLRSTSLCASTSLGVLVAAAISVPELQGGVNQLCAMM